MFHDTALGFRLSLPLFFDSTLLLQFDNWARPLIPRSQVMNLLRPFQPAQAQNTMSLFCSYVGSSNSHMGPCTLRWALYTHGRQLCMRKAMELELAQYKTGLLSVMIVSLGLFLTVNCLLSGS